MKNIDNALRRTHWLAAAKLAGRVWIRLMAAEGEYPDISLKSADLAEAYGGWAKAEGLTQNAEQMEHFTRGAIAESVTVEIPF